MELKDFFYEYTEVAIGFSGGVDSAYLAYEAKKYAKKVCAYYVKSAFQPEFEFEDAKKLAAEYDIPMKVLTVDVLASDIIRSNPCDRCYYCKQVIFGTILEAAKADGFSVLLDGTNASDEENDRPGMKVLKELKVLSPLRICGLDKKVIREKSREAGLFTWNKPAYACLATRIATKEEITAEKLFATEEAENYLFSLGFKDFRVRRVKDQAKLQVKEDQISLVLQHREEIITVLKRYYKSVVLDLEVRE